MKIIDIGNGHGIPAASIRTIMKYGSRPTIQIRQEAEKHNKAVDLSGGKKTKCLLLIRGGYVIVSSVTSDTITKRMEQEI